MNVITIQVLIDGVTVVLSVVGASFAAGIRIGSIETTLHGMAERLARIEGLFELRLKGPNDL